MFEFRNTALTVFAVLIANPQGIHSLPKSAPTEGRRNAMKSLKQEALAVLGLVISPDVGLVISVALLVMIFVAAAMIGLSDSQRGL